MCLGQQALARRNLKARIHNFDDTLGQHALDAGFLVKNHTLIGQQLLAKMKIVPIRRFLPIHAKAAEALAFRISYSSIKSRNACIARGIINLPIYTFRKIKRQTHYRSCAFQPFSACPFEAHALSSRLAVPS